MRLKARRRLASVGAVSYTHLDVYKRQVLRLRDLNGFLAGKEPLPQRSVVITIDDGYELSLIHI